MLSLPSIPSGRNAKAESAVELKTCALAGSLSGESLFKVSCHLNLLQAEKAHLQAKDMCTHGNIRQLCLATDEYSFASLLRIYECSRA